MASKYLEHFSFIVRKLIIGLTHFFDSSCNFFVSYDHGHLLVAEDLQHTIGSDTPSRAPEIASLNQCRPRLWYARPVGQGLGSSCCRGWNSPVGSTHNVEFLLECLGRLAEMAVSVS